METRTKPRVALIGTGGTISSIGRDSLDLRRTETTSAASAASGNRTSSSSGSALRPASMYSHPGHRLGVAPTPA